MNDWLSSPGGTAVLAIITSLLSGTVVYNLIRVIPERRKITAETVTENVTAAAVLTERALDMVREIREGADARITEIRTNCDQRVAEAHEAVEEAHRREHDARQWAQAADLARREAEERSSACQREIGHLLHRLAQWEDWAIEGKEPPHQIGENWDGSH